MRTLGNRGRPPVPEKTLDSKSRKDYTKYTKSGGDQSAKLVAPAQKLNQARMNDPRETVTHRAEGEGKNSQAKGSDQDGTSESAIARSDREAHQRGNQTRRAHGNLSGNDGGRKTRGVFLSFFAPVFRT